MKKNTEDAKALLDDMASNDNYPYSDRNHPKRGGKYDVDSLTMLNTTMQAMVKKNEQLDSRTSSTVAPCEICSVVGHNQNICQFNPSGLAMEQSNVLYNQNQRQQYNPYSNTYNPGWRDHFNFSYRNTQAQAQLPPTQPQKSNLENLLEGFISTQKKKNDNFDATEKAIKEEAVEEEKKEPVFASIKPYVSHVPFSRRLAEAKLKKKYGEFLEILQKLHINISFMDALSEMPSYVKFMKDILSRKRKIEESSTISVTVECSAILQVCKISSWVLEDVPLKVGKFYIPCDFVVMEMEEDANIYIILGRPFLATAGAIIDMKNGRILFQVGEEKMEFKLQNTMGHPSMYEIINRVDALEEVIYIKANIFLCEDPLQAILEGDMDEENKECMGYEKLLDVAPLAMLDHSIVLRNEEVKESITPPRVELKPLPASLKYVFIVPNNSYYVIVNVELDDIQIELFLTNSNPSKRPRKDDFYMFICFYWPTFFKDVHQYVQSCDRCQRTRNISRRNEMPLNSILEEESFDVWGVDCMGPFAPSFQNKYILVVVDYVSKWVEAIATPTNDAHGVSKFFKKTFFSRIGVPRILISDGGKHFLENRFESMLKKYGVHYKLGLSYHPQTSG
ncbi:uncharacterized protein LOC141685577 [Apium graveolens]|uniref:uncharacterized protein LOC141685577 n=1 Tax=Apium graveolens TaxID=4045 RepID=UPI003D7A9805